MVAEPGLDSLRHAYDALQNPNLRTGLIDCDVTHHCHTVEGEPVRRGRALVRNTMPTGEVTTTITVRWRQQDT